MGSAETDVENNIVPRLDKRSLNRVLISKYAIFSPVSLMAPLGFNFDAHSRLL